MARNTGLDILAFVHENKKERRLEKEREQQVALSLLQLSSQIEEKRKDREVQLAMIQSESLSNAGKLASEYSAIGAVIPTYDALNEIDKTSGGNDYLQSSLNFIKRDALWQGEVHDNARHARNGNAAAIEMDQLYGNKNWIVDDSEIDLYITAQDEKTNGEFSKSMSGDGDLESFRTGAKLGSAELKNLADLQRISQLISASKTGQKKDKLIIERELKERVSPKLSASDKNQFRSDMTNALKQMKLNFSVNLDTGAVEPVDKKISIGGVETTLGQIMLTSDPAVQFIKDYIATPGSGIASGETFYNTLAQHPDGEAIEETLRQIWPGSMEEIISRGDSLLNSVLFNPNRPEDNTDTEFEFEDSEFDNLGF
jgi:hypothetical protein